MIGQQTFPANRKGLQALQRSKQSASRNAVGLWRVQAASGDPWHRSSWLCRRASGGRPAQALLLAGVRVLSTGNARKNDALDATFTALSRSAKRSAELGPTRGWSGQGHAEILRLLTERREDLVCENAPVL